MARSSEVGWRGLNFFFFFFFFFFLALVAMALAGVPRSAPPCSLLVGVGCRDECVSPRRCQGRGMQLATCRHRARKIAAQEFADTSAPPLSLPPGLVLRLTAFLTLSHRSLKARRQPRRGAQGRVWCERAATGGEPTRLQPPAAAAASDRRPRVPRKRWPR